MSHPIGRCLALAATLVALPQFAATAQQRAASPVARVAAAIRPEAIWAPLRFLSDDLLEGRGTGARGGEIAVQYIASEFMGLGLQPAGDSGTWFQQVPIVSQRPSATMEYTAGGAAHPLRFRQDFVAWSERIPPGDAAAGATDSATVDASGEIVFVGFGIAAPENRWDDYKGEDFRGKVLLMLVNDPGLRDSTLFRGTTLTYYGRWTYKLEEAARRGAAGVLLIHNDTMATYGWNTVVNSWTGDQVRLLTPNTSLQWAGWITESAAAAMLRDGGLDPARLMHAAEQRDFRPVRTGITVHGVVTSTVRRTTTANVVARLPGSDPALRDQVVVIGAHWDHHGIGRPVNGDSILNGALDNASGVASMLAVADAYVRAGVAPRRSLLFVAFTAEEKGLLGSQAFAEHPPVPARDIAAILNIDGANLWGRTRDIGALGTEQSSLGRTFAQAARAEGLTVTTSAEALKSGSFFRSDHFPFAKVGVPGLSFQAGEDFLGRPRDWGRQQREEYTRLRYHQPGDEILPWYTVDGAVQEARVLARVAWLVGEAPGLPTWEPTSEFRAAGERRLGR
jgi:Zn-dependent M28 family amino/carboxypeptidase